MTGSESLLMESFPLVKTLPSDSFSTPNKASFYNDCKFFIGSPAQVLYPWYSQHRGMGRAGGWLLLVSYQSMRELSQHCLRLLPCMQETYFVLKHLWDQSTLHVHIPLELMLVRARLNTTSMPLTLWLFSFLPNLQKSLPVLGPWKYHLLINYLFTAAIVIPRTWLLML